MQIILPSILGYEVVARDAVASLARRCGISPERVEDVKTALCEACTNAIEHGNRSDPQRKVQVLCTVDEQRLVIEVYDEGGSLPMLPRKPVQWTLEQRASLRGMGLMLIVTLTDEVSVVADPNDGTCMRLVFYRNLAGESVSAS